MQTLGVLRHAYRLHLLGTSRQNFMIVLFQKSQEPVCRVHFGVYFMHLTVFMTAAEICKKTQLFLS